MAKLSKVATGFGWTTVSTLVNGVTQVLRLSILSRFLTKEDFGIVTIITFVLGLTQVFSDLGFSAAIMSEKDLKRGNFLGLYWMQLIFYITLIVLVVFFSPFIANYYSQPSLKILIPLALLELFFMGVGRLYDTLLQKKLQFKTIAIRNVISALISLIVAIVLAYFNFGAYSLVISTVTHAAIVQIWNFILGQKDYPISFQDVDFKQSTNLMKVGFYQMGTQIVDYFGSKIDIIVISRFLGVEVLGVYNLVKELVLKFVMVINTIVNRVMLPTFSERFTSLEQLKKSFLSFIENLSVLNFPLIGFVFVFRYFLITLFYGSQYTEATQLFGVMSIWSLFVVMSNPNGMIAIVTKNTRISFQYTIARLVIMSIVVYFVGRHSLIAAALSMLIVYLIMFFVNWRILLKRILNISLLEYLRSFIRLLIVVIVISICCDIIVSYNLFSIKYVVLQFVIYGIMYVALVLAYLFIIEKRMIRNMREALIQNR